MYYHLIFVFIIYSLYVQLSPTMGNIWLRSNSEGDPIFCPLNLFELMVAPLQSDKLYFWEPHFWPINFFVYMISYMLVYFICNNIWIYH